MVGNVIPLLPARDIRFHTFSGKLGPHARDEDVALYNHVYDFWETYWQKVMASIQSSLPPTEEFFRQDQVLTLIDHSGEQPCVVAFVGVNQYHLGTAVTRHPYFSNYDESFVRHLQNSGVRSAWSGQFITVNEAYGPRLTRVNYASIILGLMHQHYAPFSGPHTAMIGVARTDNGSFNTVKKFGWQTVGAPITLHNVKVNQVCFTGPLILHPDPAVNALVQYFWQRRTQHESGYQEEISTRANAA